MGDTGNKRYKLDNCHDSNNNIIFFRVWRNVVINKIIFNHSRYIKNKQVKFNDIHKLREYGEREYISTLVYSGKGTLCKGDLPENGVLKEVNLSSGVDPLQKNNRISSGDIFPQGVEIIHFPYTINISEVGIQLSELPTSVHTITDVLLKKPYSNNQIPSNITSLSFHALSYNGNPINGFYDIVIPNSVKKLNLECLYHGPGELPIAPPSFIPSSVTDLIIWYNEGYKLNLPSIPSSVTKLHIYISGSDYYFSQELIPFGVKELTIDGLESGGAINLSENSLPDSLTKLVIICGSEQMDRPITANSMPNSVLDLNISFLEYPASFIDIFPSSLTCLEIDSLLDKNPPPSISELPSTLKYLKIDEKEIPININNK